MAFNLLEDPWIDVIDEDNNCRSVGIIDIFKDAHLIKDLKTMKFHGILFPLYNYLAIRLLCGILVDAYNEAEEDFDAEEIIADGNFDVSSGSILGTYLETYKDRFELFDSKHPFMQTGDDDLEKWKELGSKPDTKPLNVMKVSPCSPAESARISEVKNEEFAEFLKVVRGITVDPFYGANLDSVGKDGMMSAFAEVYSIPAKEWAYICMYHNCVFPGVGSGNKSGLAGNSYYAEIIQGKNLFQTIAMNSVSISLSDNRISNKPLWRWESQTDIFLDENKVTLDMLSGLFCPSKIIRANKVEDNVVKSIIQAPLRFGDDENKEIIDDLREKWAVEFEPHFVVNYMQFPIKRTKEGKRQSPYRKFPDSNIRLWTPIGATQTNTNHLSEDMLGSLAMAARNTREEFNGTKFTGIFGEDVHIRIYYRICNGKWVYQSTGMQDGVIPVGLMTNEKRQSFVRAVITFSVNACEKLDKCASRYYMRSGITPSSDLSNRLYSFLGVNGEKGKYLFRVSNANSKEDFDELWDEFCGFVGAECRRIWGRRLIPGKTVEFYKNLNEINKFLNGKEGKGLYARKH